MLHAPAVTRTIGDSDCRTYICSEPFHAEPLVPERGGAVVLCSDGVWDHLRPDEVSAILLAGGYSGPAEVSRKIIKASLKKHRLSDDASVHVWREVVHAVLQTSCAF